MTLSKSLAAANKEIERLQDGHYASFKAGFRAGWRAIDDTWIDYDAAEQHYWKDYCGVTE